MKPIIFGLLFFFSSLTWAFPSDVKEVEINGFKVFLINTHYGNGVALTSNILAGSWNDEPVHFAGRSHLWEHVIHGGSKKYPGQKTLWTLLPRMGADYNAYTSDTRIFYHYYIHPDALPEAASLLGAMISEPEWNEKTFEKEKQTVKNEAKEYEGQNGRVLQSSIFLNLLPSGHPLAMYDVGTQAQLDAMTLNDLKELYYSNYTPDSLQIIVAANFDTLPENPVLNLIKDNFFPPNVQKDPSGYRLPPNTRPLKEKIFPPIVDPSEESSHNFIELGTKSNQRALQFVFQASNDWATKHPETLETLLDFLNLRNQGSLNDIFNKKGWATGIGFSSEKINNLTLVEFQAELTAEGAKNKGEILNLLFANFNNIKKQGLQPDLLEYLKLRNIQSYGQSVTEADAAAEFFATNLSRNSVAPSQAFDFKKRYGTVNEEDLKAAVAQAFDGPVIGGYIGPDIDSKDRTKVFDRPFVLSRMPVGKNLQPTNLSKLDLEIDISKDIILSKIPINFSSVPIVSPTDSNDQEAKVLKTNQEGTRLVLQESHQVPQGGIRFQIKMPRLSKRSSVAITMYLRAFSEHFKSEIGYLNSMGITVHLGAKSNSINAMVSGNSGGAISVTKWLFTQLKAYDPSEKEIELVREKMGNEFESSKQEFSANVAFEATRPLIHQQAFSVAEKSKELSTLKNEDIEATVRLKLNRSDLTLVMAGDYNQDAATSLLNDLTDLFPKRLTDYQRTEIANIDNEIKGQLTYWEKATSTKSEDAFGIVRVYDGPAAQSREGAAMLVLSKSLATSVFQLNRIERELGYVHSFSPVLTQGGLKLAFMGQTEGIEKFPQVQLGWAELIERIKNKTLSKDSFESEKIGILRTQSLIPKNIADQVYQIFADFDLRGNPNATKELSAMISTLQPNEIYEAGEKYLSSSDHFDVVSSSKKPNVCGPLLASLRSARSFVKNQVSRK